jgi:hypothetical protein
VQRFYSALVLSLLVAVSGCDRVQRTRECRKLARTVNAALNEIEPRAQSAPNDPAVLRQLALRYEQLANELGSVGFSRKETARDIADYRLLFVEAAQLLRRAASAIEQKDERGVSALRLEFERIERREKAHAAVIDSSCLGG